MASEALAQGGGAGNTRSGGSYVAKVTTEIGAGGVLTSNHATFAAVMDAAKTAYANAVHSAHPDAITKITLLADFDDTGDGNTNDGQNPTIKLVIDLNGHKLGRASDGVVLSNLFRIQNKFDSTTTGFPFKSGRKTRSHET